MLRDATLEDVQFVRKRVKYSTNRFFGKYDLGLKFKTSAYSLLMEHENSKIIAYANFEASPNINALPRGCWLDWIKFHYGLTEVTYGNTFFITIFLTHDPYEPRIVHQFYKEVFHREPKLKYICIVSPPIDSVYEDIFGVHCKRIYSLDQSINRLSQSLFVCERHTILPKMRFRRALAEDNDDIVEIIDKKLPSIRIELGDFYIAEQVLRNDPSENIVVAEISNVTIGMIWINTNIHRKALVDNFEVAAYGNFLRPQQCAGNIENRAVIDLVRKRSNQFFDKGSPGSMGGFSKDTRQPQEDYRMSLNNLYISSSETSEVSDESAEKIPRNLFAKWEQIHKNLKGSRNYRTEVRKIVKMPKTIEVTNAFAIQLFGLCSTIDPRRIFDILAATFLSYPDKDYCIISLSSSEASSDSLSGPLLKYFSRVVPRPGCKISDCLYVTHKNTFLAEIELNYLTFEDIPDIEKMLCLSEFKGQAMYFLADITQRMTEYLEDPWSPYEILIMRCEGCAIGFAVLRQNCRMCELRTHFVIYDDDDSYPDWKVGQLKYLDLHPAFMWEWVHVTREIFRLTGHSSMYFKLRRELNQPVLNNILLNMFPIFPRKRIQRIHEDVNYALYYLNVKMSHLKRDQIENKIVIVGFNETCKGFLRTLIFSPDSKQVQCLNITVITDSPGFIEAEHDTESFEKQDSLFFQAKNQFSSQYLRQLEFRTWVAFIGGGLKGIYGNKKRIVLDTGATLRYDRLFLMCSSRYNPPVSSASVPVNYLEMNGRLDKIIFYNKIRLLVMEITEHTLPILVYGAVVMAHSCVNTLIELGIEPSQIALIAPLMKAKIDFPETFEDEYVMNFVQELEEKAGVKIYKGLRFLNWNLNAKDNSIESVIFESQFEIVTIKCLAFICFHGNALPEDFRNILESQNIKTLNNKIVIDEYCRTSIPYVYACGRITQYQSKLFAAQIEQRYFNQIEIGNQKAVNFILERRTGEQVSMLDANFVKPIFRQSQIIGGLIYGGLRKPGRYVPRDIRKNLHNYGRDLITRSLDGEYCRVCIDTNGFINEITCLTRKYKDLEVLYRIYGLHETYFNNIRTRCDCGDIESLLDFFHENSFKFLLHDQFPLLKDMMRRKNLECLKEFFRDHKTVDKRAIQEYLKEKGMHEVIQMDLIAFISKHWESLHPHYALPHDFST